MAKVGKSGTNPYQEPLRESHDWAARSSSSQKMTKMTFFAKGLMTPGKESQATTGKYEWSIRSSHKGDQQTTELAWEHFPHIPPTSLK